MAKIEVKKTKIDYTNLCSVIIGTSFFVFLLWTLAVLVLLVGEVLFDCEIWVIGIPISILNLVISVITTIVLFFVTNYFIRRDDKVV